MTKRGRKSAAELALAPVVTVIPRPPAPYALNDDEAGLWERYVACMRADYFGAETHETLANLCRHQVTARRISHWIEKILTGEGPAAKDAEVEDLDRLLRMRERETRTANALARSLRLTKQSTISPRGAGNAGASEIQKPWEVK